MSKFASESGKAVSLGADAPAIKFSTKPPEIAEMRQVSSTAKKEGGSWLTLKVSLEASADQGGCKKGLQVALSNAGFKYSLSFHKEGKYKVAVNTLHCKVVSVPQPGTFDCFSDINFYIKKGDDWSPQKASFQKLAPELFTLTKSLKKITPKSARRSRRRNFSWTHSMRLSKSNPPKTKTLRQTPYKAASPN